MEYEVREDDSLEKIAALHDCTVGELVAANKLRFRMVFPGQRIIIPQVQHNNELEISKNKALDESESTSKTTTLPPRRNTVSSPPSRERKNGFDKVKHSTFEERTRRMSSELGHMDSKQYPSIELIEDEECLQRFLKVRVKHITELDGTVVGTLIITPTALMFDPDELHPLVQEKGPELYSMIAKYKRANKLAHQDKQHFLNINYRLENMDDIVAISMFSQFESLTEPEKKPTDIFRPTPCSKSDSLKSSNKLIGETTSDFNGKFDENQSAVATPNSILENYPSQVHFDMGVETVSADEENNPDNKDRFSVCSGRIFQFPDVLLEPNENIKQKNESIDAANDLSQRQDLDSPASLYDEERKRGSAEDLKEKPFLIRHKLDSHLSVGSDKLSPTKSTPEMSRSRSPSPFSRLSRSPRIARESFGKLGKTLSNAASNAVQTVATNTQKAANTAVEKVATGTQKVSLSVQSSAKVVANVPGQIVNVSVQAVNAGAELLQDKGQSIVGALDHLKSSVSGNNDENELAPIKCQILTEAAIKRERSLAVLDNLITKTEQERVKAVQQRQLSQAQTQTLMSPGNEEISTTSLLLTESEGPIASQPTPPYYMTIRIDHRRLKQRRRLTRGSVSTFPISDDLAKLRREYWFAVPADRVNQIYYFLLYWTPNKYGEDSALPSPVNNTAKQLDSPSVFTSSHLTTPASESMNAPTTHLMSTTTSSTLTSNARSFFVVLDSSLEAETNTDHLTVFTGLILLLFLTTLGSLLVVNTLLFICWLDFVYYHNIICKKKKQHLFY